MYLQCNTRMCAAFIVCMRTCVLYVCMKAIEQQSSFVYIFQGQRKK